MKSIFRRSETAPDAHERHSLTLDLIEQVAELRGQVRSMKTEWDDIRVQIKKGYQRMEKANERAEKRQPPDTPQTDIDIPVSGFAKKLSELTAG